MSLFPTHPTSCPCDRVQPVKIDNTPELHDGVSIDEDTVPEADNIKPRRMDVEGREQACHSIASRSAYILIDWIYHCDREQ
jgi:hypothetical protein